MWIHTGTSVSDSSKANFYIHILKYVYYVDCGSFPSCPSIVWLLQGTHSTFCFLRHVQAWPDHHFRLYLVNYFKVLWLRICLVVKVILFHIVIILLQNFTAPVLLFLFVVWLKLIAAPCALLAAGGALRFLTGCSHTMAHSLQEMGCESV